METRIYPIHQFTDFSFYAVLGQWGYIYTIKNFNICFNKKMINPKLFNIKINLEHYSAADLFWLSGPVLNFLELKGLKFERTKLYEKLKPTLVFNTLGN